MSYDIQPRECARVGADTDTERDQLQDGLQRVVPLVGEAISAARAGAPVAAELDRFLAEHHRLSREILARIDSALTHGAAAVDAYVRQDTAMAEQYARASVVFAGPVAPFTPLAPGAVAALPPNLRG